MGKPKGNGLKLGNFSKMEDLTRNKIWFEWILAENHGEFMWFIVNNMILGFVGFVQELGCIPPTGSDQQPHHGSPQRPSEKDMIVLGGFEVWEAKLAYRTRGWLWFAVYIATNNIADIANFMCRCGCPNTPNDSNRYSMLFPGRWCSTPPEESSRWISPLFPATEQHLAGECTNYSIVPWIWTWNLSHVSFGGGCMKNPGNNPRSPSESAGWSSWIPTLLFWQWTHQVFTPSQKTCEKYMFHACWLNKRIEDLRLTNSIDGYPHKTMANPMGSPIKAWILWFFC
jgi:hypothetical protein